ncbi:MULTISPECIES: SDR family oxidoreductase [unclassified Sphingobium]|uniref:SDR family oxidoreductase n=1 Tax=unclassified Sphingobium TaxID=2611147 RepID=UPI00076FFF8F|nr:MULTISPECIES: SDR family oxidoreductase [Sphingomonadaceae]AMK22302.1 short-chain dehydrogenase/reductase SDR [Sphingobium sp. TKS]NML88431.1 SDR family NAD(P)-dependent oxidoreductase [Sphingobium sp. TB-6]
MQKSGNTILITGGGSGIGAALAHEFHAAGNQVIIAGRRQAALDAVVAEHPGMAALTVDMENPEAIATFAGKVVSDFPALNVVIHNAGMMTVENRIDLAVAEATIVTNLLGPIRLTHALLPHLLAQPAATLMTVTSGLAFVPLAATPTYSATKAALHSWSLSMREQLKGTSVEVIELAPPGVQTDLMPGHAENPQMMPLDAYIAEVMGLLGQEPALEEICVERVKFLRDAERRGEFAQVFGILNAGH